MSKTQSSQLSSKHSNLGVVFGPSWKRENRPQNKEKIRKLYERAGTHVILLWIIFVAMESMADE